MPILFGFFFSFFSLFFSFTVAISRFFSLPHTGYVNYVTEDEGEREKVYSEKSTMVFYSARNDSGQFFFFFYILEILF